MQSWSLFLVGACIAGFIQGLTGFAFALVAMSFWVWALPPQLAAPLVVFASLWCHIIALSKERPHQLGISLVVPYIIAGLIGVPLGSYLLHQINAETFKLILGVFLLIWCPIMYLAPEFKLLKRLGKKIDAVIGFLGGVLGGLGGFCGSLPSAWVMLKGLNKIEQRYILRHFNFAIQLFTFAVYIFQGTVQLNQWPYIMVLMISVTIPAILGSQLFYKVSEKQFKHIVLSLLFASGTFLVISTVI